MTDIYIPSNEQDAEEIAQAIKSISDSMTRIEAERDNIKEIKKVLKENWELPLFAINNTAKLYHEQKSEEHFAKQNDLQELYTKLFDKAAD